MNKIIFSLTVLEKTNREISVEIKNQGLFDLGSWNYEIFVIKKSIMKINAVEFMYVKSCYKSSTSKYEKSNSNINISKISHLPFDIFVFHLKNDDTVPNTPKINQFLKTISFFRTALMVQQYNN